MAKSQTMKKPGGRNSGNFVKLSPADIAKENYLMPGRRECFCEASKHKLINNCVECGKIVCEQEGSGPCFFCGSLVCTPKEKEIIMKQNKSSFKLYNKLMNSSGDTNISKSDDAKLERAREHRDKLLEYDRTMEKRTKVIDDESDFFMTNNKWLSQKEREILDKKKDEVYEMMHDRHKLKFTLDFAGRKVVEETPQVDIDVDELLRPEVSIFDHQGYPALDMPEDLQLVYQEPNKPYQYRPPTTAEKPKNYSRIQDKDLLEMSDEGKCLSLHQPYASLLVAGIKCHEGRSWYTSHRGRLWIHSAGKPCSQEEIDQMKNIFRTIKDVQEFPKSYPTGCLLGCVDIVECLPQDEYRILYPKGEIGSPYVFVCENAQELSIKFPMKGKNNIYNLEKNIHQAAKKTLIKKM